MPIRSRTPQTEPTTTEATQADGGLPCDVVDADETGGYGCAITRSGEVYCWGDNAFHQLGRADAPDDCASPSPDDLMRPCSFQPLRVEGLTGIVDIALLGGSACALREDGRVSCWGLAYSGLLGTQVDTTCFDPGQKLEVPCSATPVLVEGIEHATQLAAWGNTCALEASGAVKCWGYTSATASPVPGVQDAIQLAANCVLRANGDVACWGANDAGALGTTSHVADCDGPYAKPCSIEPLPVAIQHVSTNVSSGWQHACAVADDGTLECWGDNSYGQLGSPATDSPRCYSGYACEMLPRPVPDLSDVARVFAGTGGTCALTSDGRALCWGNLPDSYVTNAPADVPREIELPGKVKTMTSERGAACFVLEDGALYCYGLHWAPRESDGIGELVPNGVPVRMCD